VGEAASAGAPGPTNGRDKRKDQKSHQEKISVGHLSCEPLPKGAKKAPPVS